MVSMRSIKKFCKGDYTKIENYEEAAKKRWQRHRQSINILTKEV